MKESIQNQEQSQLVDHNQELRNLEVVEKQNKIRKIVAALVAVRVEVAAEVIKVVADKAKKEDKKTEKKEILRIMKLTRSLLRKL